MNIKLAVHRVACLLGCTSSFFSSYIIKIQGENVSLSSTQNQISWFTSDKSKPKDPIIWNCKTKSN